MTDPIGPEAPENQTAAPPKRPLRRLAVITVNMLIALIFIGAMGLGIWTLHSRAGAKPAPKKHPPVAVETQILEPQPSYRATSSYVGRLEPARQTDLAFERGGLVLNVHPEEGSIVKKGDIVAELDTDQLKASRQQLEAQQRELEARRNLAILTRKRKRKLRDKGWSPDQRFDEANANVEELNAAIERIAAQIKSIDIDIQKSKLIAPFSGTISARAIDEGSVIAAGTMIVRLLETSRIEARIGLPPEVAQTLDEIKEYKLRAGTQYFKAKLSARRPDLQFGTRTVTVLFDVVGEQTLLFGDIVTLELETTVSEQGTWLPLTALKEGHKGLWTVLVVESTTDDFIVRSEAVEILHANGPLVYARGTFKPGARILVNGTNRVTSGQRVAIAKDQ